MCRAVLVLLALSGCSNGYSEMRRSVPRPDADAFDECRDFLSGRACRTGETGFYGMELQAACLSKMATQYARLTSTADRRTFLVEAGCPSSIVRQALPGLRP